MTDFGLSPRAEQAIRDLIEWMSADLEAEGVRADPTDEALRQYWLRFYADRETALRSLSGLLLLITPLRLPAVRL